MKKGITKKSTKAFVLTLACVLICFFGIYLSTFAQENGQNGQAAPKKDINCAIEMKPFLKEKSAGFREYLTQHFQNKSTNSSLLNLALERFKEYKADLRKELNKYYPQAGLPQQTETVESLECYRQMKKEITIMRNLLEKFYLETSNIKTTSIHMNKLKSINKKLDELYRNTGSMHGKWEALKDKIPCFVSSCLSG